MMLADGDHVWTGCVCAHSCESVTSYERLLGQALTSKTAESDAADRLAAGEVDIMSSARALSAQFVSVSWCTFSQLYSEAAY